MGVTASLGERAPTVESGGSTAFDVTLRNDGASAETVRLRVSGPAKPYAYVVPDSVSLEPGGHAVARLGFRVPRSSLPAAGPLPFRLEVSSDVGNGSDSFAEGVLEVAPFSSLSTTLDPAEATGQGPSRHQLSVGNRGNSPVRVELRAATDDGLDVVIQPTSIVTSPGATAMATVEVTPRGRPFTGSDRHLSFTISATPDVGDPVDTPGRRRVPAAVATRKLVTSGVVAGIVVIGLAAWAIASSGGSSPSSAGPDNVPTTASGCPAAGHLDVRGANGLRPEDIPNLPNSYSFLFVKNDNCTPIRFNPCEPVHYVQNDALAPPTGAADVREGFARLAQATGITFVDDGTTDEISRRGAYVPDRYGARWAPILVTWTHFPNQGNDPAIQSVGFGIGSRVGDILVSGVLSLNVDAVTNKDTRTPVQGGFGPPIGTGTGAIGPADVTWGRIIIHELAHVIGLGHTRDKGAIMYPETAEQTSRPTEYRPPDRDGLRYLGREAGCLTTPPLPNS